MASPNLVSFVLANSGQAYNLDALVQAKKLGIYRPNGGYIALFISIQSDPGNQSAKLAVGNANVSLTNCGSTMFAGQSVPYYSMEANIVNLSHIYLYTDTPGIQVNVSWLTR